MQPALTTPLRIGDIEISNRVLLAPLAGIGNWFVRLQARRHGAGLAVSEMVSSFALHHRNRRTQRELLVVHPDEHPVSIQLFGHDPDVMRSAAAIAAGAGADLIDINMGCPVRKVCKTGAGAALLGDHDLAVRIATAAIEGSGRPVTVKLRSGLEPGDRSGVELGLRLADAGVAAIALHPRPASIQHSGSPDYRLVRELAERIDVPVVVSGGLDSAGAAAAAYRASGAAAVMIARGALGNPWIFGELTGSAFERAAARRGRRRAAVGDRPRRGAPRARARERLPAQVLPLVSRAPRPPAARQRAIPARGDAGRGEEPGGRARRAPARVLIARFAGPRRGAAGRLAQLRVTPVGRVARSL